MKLFKRLWQDQRGFVNSAELVFICTILGIGLIPGVAAVRWAILHELKDTARAISHSDSDEQEWHHGDHHWDGDQGGGEHIYTAQDYMNS